MEINTVQNQQYQTSTQETEQYIAPKNVSGFNDIKVKILEVIENLISPKELNVQDELNDKFLELDFGSVFDIDAAKIGISDAVFFVNLLNQENIINYSVEDNSISISKDGEKINVTNSLINMLKTSYDTNKPIRLDFDNDVTVILKLDKEGKIQTHFIPGSKEVENYLKNNISSLRQIFDEEEIRYSHLDYSKHKEENRQKQKRSKQ